MDEKVYWIWLQQALKYGNYKVKNIRDFYDSMKDFYNDGERNWRLCGIFNNSDIELLNSCSIEDARIIFEKCNKLSYEIIVPGDKNYSENLWNISNPPAVLYVLGDSSVLNNNINIAVVGTRNASYRGVSSAEELSYSLASSGAIVVSGGAIGIDRAAHTGALKAGKKTIAVLGCGINFNYLTQNSGLRFQISKNGALVSEYPPDYPAYNYNFPMRNRIISGLSVATIVVEAGKKSGSLITANLANEQGRDVFVMPIDINSPLCSGAMALVEDGAKIITHVESLVESYRQKYTVNLFKNNKYTRQNIKDTYNNSSQKDVKNNKKNKNLDNLKISPGARRVYDLILKYKKLHVDEICVILNIEIKKLLPVLTELEIYNLIRASSGRNYEII